MLQTVQASLSVFQNSLHTFTFSSTRFFSVRLVAKRYVLQQKCLNGQIGTCLQEAIACWYNFQPQVGLYNNPRSGSGSGQQSPISNRISRRATVHSVTDRQMDGQTTGPCQQLGLADHTVQQYDRLKWTRYLAYCVQKFRMKVKVKALGKHGDFSCTRHKVIIIGMSKLNHYTVDILDCQQLK